MPHASVFTDQSADSLCLSLVQGQLDVTPYSVLWEKVLHTDNLTVTARVIGASHIITYAAEDVLLHEMLACTEPPLDVKSFRLSLKADDTHHVEMRTGRLHYVFDSRRINWVDREPTALQELVEQASATDETSVGVVYAFPQGNLPAIPKTVLWCSTSRDGKSTDVHTAHSYPGQAVVFSHSSITRTDS